MASTLQRLQANEDDVIWRQNASLIRQLYQEERKTLKEVKAIMENDKGFPVTPLRTWEIKLRGLGMQKKLKSRDWSLVYQHVRPRLQHEGKKKLRRPTAVLINNTKKPWDDVWKEIRRNRALIVAPRRGPLPPLPHGIIIRTPSPEFLNTTHQNQQPQHSKSLAIVRSGLTIEGRAEYAVKSLPSSLSGARRGESQDDRVTSAFSPLGNLTVTGRATSWKLKLTDIKTQLMLGSESAASGDQDLGPNFDGHHYLSMIIFLLSNDLINARLDRTDFCTILEMAFTFVSRGLLWALFQSHLPSIKAAWEKLFLGAQDLENKEAFRFLINVGMDNDWLKEQSEGHEYLFFAVKMKCWDILHALLGRGCRPRPYYRLCFNESIIVEALRNGNLDCAKALIQHCDINHEFRINLKIIPGVKSTNFATFIMNFNDTQTDHLFCLKIFLEQGANVDYEIDLKYVVQRDIPLYQATIYGLAKDWPVSILDYIYYRHCPLFPKLAGFSEHPSRFSRSRALWHLDQGVDAFRKYLASNPDFPVPWGEVTGHETNKTSSIECKNRCLEILLAEQFLLCRGNPEEDVWWTRMQSLSQLDFDLTWLSRTEGLAASMLYATACRITTGEGAEKEHGLQMMQWLLDQGFQVKADALKAATWDDQGDVLECLASFCGNLESEGSVALCDAVAKNRFKAAKMLLDRSVDPNTTIGGGFNVFEEAACGSSLAMMKYLVQRGAKPRPLKQGDHPCHLLMIIIYEARKRFDPIPDLFKKVQYITEKYVTISGPSCPSAHLLEMLISGFSGQQEEKRICFEFLLKKGAKVSPGSPLAEWIVTGGGHQLVREMLDAGANPDAYSFDTHSKYWNGMSRTPLQAAAWIGDYPLVCLLLERGVDANQPAFGDNGMTALQAICMWNPVRREERLRKDKIIKLLLEKGADVNAVNSEGLTALICAADLGDLSAVFILLKHRAKLDAILRMHYYSQTDGKLQQTALDAAAWNGRLDMVKFLLNANALSWTAYSGGKDYDGAIEWARNEGHFVVSELICKHSADRQRWDVPNGQEAETRVPRDHIPESLSLRAESGTASWSQTEARLPPGENLQDVINLDELTDLSYALGEGMVEGSPIAPKAKGRGMSGGEATALSRTRVIEEIENEPPLGDTGCEKPGGENSGGGVSQDSTARKASSRPGGWLYRPTDQDWVEDEQQNVDALVPNSLTTDVFMGFSEFPSL